MTLKTSQTLVRHPQRAQTGFTLVEIMVGLVIGMLASAVVMQVFSVFESQKRATTGAADAMTNGNVALFEITRDMQNAGYGLVSTKFSPLQCPTPLFIDPLPAVASSVSDISPVTITDNYGNTGSDAIIIRYGDTDRGGTATVILGAPVPGSGIPVTSNIGCVQGDIAIAINSSGNQCEITQVSAAVVPLSPPPVYPANPIGVAGEPVPLDDYTVVNTPAAAHNGTLACLGSWHEVTYSVNTSNANGNWTLQRKESFSPTSGIPSAPTLAPLAAGVVNIQAQYGISARPGSNLIVNWVDAANGQALGNWGPGIPAVQRNQIKAVHIAVVARDAKMELTDVTGTCTTAQGTNNFGPCAWDDTGISPAPKIDLSANANWKKYRYKVFDTIIPIRNVVWAQPILKP